MNQVSARTHQAPAPTAAVGEPEWIDRKATAQAVRAAQARQVSGRRRFVDPATCERDYSESEWEFMQAIQEYKARSGRMFPTWSEVLEVLRSLGYEKPVSGEAAFPASATLATPPTSKRRAAVKN